VLLKRTSRQKLAIAICVVSLVLVSTAQLAHSCASAAHSVPTASVQGEKIVKDGFCTLCATNLSSDPPLASPELTLAPAVERAASEAQPQAYQQPHRFVVCIRPPPFA
jgi:hypothetical protein